MNAPPRPPGDLKQLSVLIAVNLVDMIGLMLVLPILPFYASDLGASPERIGLLIASFSIAQVGRRPILGRLSDRYGRRPALVIGLTASAVAFLVFAYANVLWLLFLSRLVQGAGVGTTGVAQALLSQTRCGRRIGLRRSAGSRHQPTLEWCWDRSSVAWRPI